MRILFLNFCLFSFSSNKLLSFPPSFVLPAISNRSVQSTSFKEGCGAGGGLIAGGIRRGAQHQTHQCHQGTNGGALLGPSPSLSFLLFVPSSSANNFRQQLPPTTSTDNFRQQLPPTTSTDNFRQQLLPTTSANNFRQHHRPSHSIIAQHCTPSCT